MAACNRNICLSVAALCLFKVRLRRCRMAINRSLSYYTAVV
uniref:Uncharacterized protein n=1 Tax=Rheinheimera sp. BAL341 TaxID=1708203 RepID=A0A486XTU1_9GAMM